MLGIFVAIFIVLITLCYFYAKRRYNYWPSRGVAVPPYLPVLGHIFPLYLKGLRWEYIDKIYKKFEDERFWGMYEGLSPVLFVKDLELLRDILVKNADHFVDRRTMNFTGKEKLFNEMLTVVKGEEWKALRSLMTPTFTSGKMKGMFPLIVSVADDFVIKCNMEIVKNSYVKINSVFGEYTMDVIASCGFGIKSNCLLGQNSEFGKAAKDMTSQNLTFLATLKLALLMVSPKLSNLLGLQFTNDSMRFLEKAVKHTITARKKSGQRRGDFLDIMLEALDEHNKSLQEKKYPMTEDTIIAESILLLFAGFDTTSNALSFTAYLLAKNIECQEKLRKELQKTDEGDGGMTYQNIMEAPYLDACFSESLRLFPLSHFLERKCTREYRVPGTEIDIKESMLMSVPVWSLHYDHKYWEEPTKYNPERFLPENKENIVPYSYMPFGQGPRNCIGMRFALLTAKIVLAKFCLNFEFSLKPGCEELTLGQSPNTLRPDKNGLSLILKKI